LLEVTSSSRASALQISLNATKTRPSSESKVEENQETMEKEEDEIAAALAAGRQVRLNDDRQVIDKRDLLSAGLNVSRRSGSRSVRQDTVDARARHEAQQAAEKRRSQDAEARERARKLEERRRRQYEEMLRQREEEKRKEKEQAEAELAAKLARRTTEEQISDARARYLARQAEKRRREAEQLEQDKDA
jgi:coiled-coil domain-containing protein 55